jgi:hypothetical protein
MKKMMSHLLFQPIHHLLALIYFLNCLGAPLALECVGFGNPPARPTPTPSPFVFGFSPLSFYFIFVLDFI